MSLLPSILGVSRLELNLIQVGIDDVCVMILFVRDVYWGWVEFELDVSGRFQIGFVSILFFT